MYISSKAKLCIAFSGCPHCTRVGCELRKANGKQAVPGEQDIVCCFQFALRASSASASEKGLSEEESALLQAIRPLVANPDCYFLAVLTALVQAILEGRTDCPISGVFGAGKTRAAAAMIASLLVMDPALKVTVVIKENAAAHAFAKHIESLQLLPWKISLVDWWVSRSSKKALPVKRDRMSHQASAMTFCAENSWLWRWLPPGMLAAIQSSCQVDEGGGHGLQ